MLLCLRDGSVLIIVRAVTQMEVAVLTCYVTQPQYTDTTLTSPSSDPIPLGAWQVSHWITSFEVTGNDSTRKNPHRKSGTLV